MESLHKTIACNILLSKLQTPSFKFDTPPPQNHCTQWLKTCVASSKILEDQWTLSWHGRKFQLSTNMFQIYAFGTCL